MTRWRRSPWLGLTFSRDRPQSAGQGQSARFASLILPHLDSAWRYARYLCRDDGPAEDIVQDAFERALKAIDQCRGDPRAWLFAILRNCHHDWARAHARAATNGSDDELAEFAAPDDQHSLAEMADLRQMIEALPEPFREALVLRELEELTYRDIAAVTSAPIGTVMSRLARARQMLGVLLRDEGTPDKKRGEA
ncbi:sigma-70 family RNA polymerase sigma factor [Novosphingobium sediminis]|uniref:sigma-70 family RNA polymerase sigma factor n=1 Tax=Novosphingobium sediminis TaxID=707214 RepID=UPI0011BE191A|nr:sigma-70 family RNA polymerase sigma factor [Novosphingobium sediminis]